MVSVVTSVFLLMVYRLVESIVVHSGILTANLRTNLEFSPQSHWVQSQSDRPPFPSPQFVCAGHTFCIYICVLGHPPQPSALFCYSEISSHRQRRPLHVWKGTADGSLLCGVTGLGFLVFCSHHSQSSFAEEVLPSYLFECLRAYFWLRRVH